MASYEVIQGGSKEWGMESRVVCLYTTRATPGCGCVGGKSMCIVSAIAEEMLQLKFAQKFQSCQKRLTGSHNTWRGSAAVVERRGDKRGFVSKFVLLPSSGFTIECIVS